MGQRKELLNLCLAGPVVGMMLAGSALAQSAPQQCEPIETPAIAHCSPNAMRAAMSDDIPAGLWRDPDRIVQSGATFPGGATLSLTGLVNDRGAACASPVSQLTAEALLMSGEMDRDDAVQQATQRAEALREQLQDAAREGDRRSRIEALRRATGMGADGTGGALGALLGESGQDRDVVLEIYSPTAWGFDNGGLLPPRGLEHDGATGWMPNAGSALVIQLPGTSADALTPGETYEAVAFAPDTETREIGDTVPTGGGFYSRWQGRYHAYVPQNGQSGRDARSQTLLREIDTMLSRSSGNRSELARLAATGEAQAFEGQTERVSGRLEGEVHIEAITDGAIYGRIALEGTARVTTEVFALTHAPDGAIRGDERVETRERSGHLAIEGRFEAPNGGRMTRMTHTPTAVPARGGARTEILRVIAEAPGDNARNIDPDDARFELVFDRIIDPASIGSETVWIEYRAYGGDIRRIDTRVRVDRDRLLIEPESALPDGAWHRLRMDGGERGPEGRDGARLALPFSSRFATLPDDIEVETEVYQVVRDAPLIANKTTASRLYVEWEPPVDVHEDWLVEDIPVNAWAEGDTGSALYAVRENVFAPHRDMATQAEERTGRNTVNLFGWSPAYQQTGRVTGVIEPVDACGVPYEEERDAQDVDWSPLQRHFSFDYFLARVGEWAHRMPEEGREIARRTVRSSEVYATQSFPVTGVSGHYAGDYVPSEAWQETYGDALLAGDENARIRLMLEIYDRVPLINGPDQTVVFFPPSVMSGGSSLRGWYDLGSEGENSWFDLWSVEGRDEDRIYSLGLNPMVEIVTIARAADTPALTHEFGHGLGLEHLPYVETTVGRSMVCNSPSHEQVNGIDGYRLALNGTGGATKSSVYGNAEHASIMRSLMFPCAGTKAEHFIHPDQYAALIERFSEPVLSRNAPGGGTKSGGAQTPSAEANRSPAERVFILAGAIEANGTVASISRMAETGTMPAGSAPDGDFTAIAYTADGSELARQSFGTVLLQETDGPYRIALTAAEAPDRIEIRRGDTVLTARTRSSSTPVVEAFEISEVDDQTVQLDWAAADADGDALHHYVLYRSAPGAVWRPVVLRTADTSATIRREALPTGEDPLFRLVSSDGFNVVEAELDASAASLAWPEPPVETQGTDTPAAPDVRAGPPRFSPDAPADNGAPVPTPPSPETETSETSPAGETGASLAVMQGRLSLAGQVHELSVDRCEVNNGNVQFGASAQTPDGGGLRIGGSMVDMGPRAFQIVEVRSLNAAGDETGPVWVAIRNGANGEWVNGFDAPAEGPLLTTQGDRLVAQGAFHERSGTPTPAGEGRMELRCDRPLE